MSNELRNALEKAGITTMEQLLDRGATKLQRQELAKYIGQSERDILTWVNRVDLMRVKGIGQEYTDLLEATGVYSVKQLGCLLSSSLFSKMLAVNREAYLVRRMPSEGMVVTWVSQAKELEQKVK
ncbi:MAG: DUF4332 domain-containing protein [Caldilineaceae bacterium]